MVWTSLRNIVYPAQEENANAKAAAAAREKKAAKKARRKERDAALKAIAEPPRAADAAHDCDAKQTSTQPAPAAETAAVRAVAVAEVVDAADVGSHLVGDRLADLEAEAARPAQASSDPQTPAAAQQNSSAAAQCKVMMQTVGAQVQARTAVPAAHGSQQSVDTREPVTVSIVEDR